MTTGKQTLGESLPATQAANVESRITALERLGQHGALPDYWRKPLALAFSADEVAASELLAENDRLRQGLWDVATVCGMDTDGDETPEHLSYPDIVVLALREVERLREDYDHACERRGPDA